MKNIYRTIYLLILLAVASPMLRAQAPEQAQRLITEAESLMLTSPKKASYLALQAVQLFPESVYPSVYRARALLAHCKAEQYLGNFDLSIKTLYDTRRYIPENDRRLIAEWSAVTGRVFGKLGDYNKGIELNDQAINTFKSLGDSAFIARCYNERGVMHYAQNEFVVAEQFLQRALRINRAQHNIKEIATNLNNLCLYQGDTEAKLRLIDEAIVINRNLDARWSMAENYNNKGKQLFYGERYAQALEALQQSYEISRELGARELLCDYYEYASWVYAAMGHYDKAYTATCQMYALNRQLQSNNRLRNIEQEISYKRIRDQRHQAEALKQSLNIEMLKRNSAILTSLLAIAVLGSCLIYIWYKRRKNNQLMKARIELEQSQRQVSELRLKQQEMEVQRKEMELKQQEQQLESVQSALDNSQREATEFAVFLSSRNELLEKIRTMIKEAYRMDDASVVPHLKKVNAFIAQSQNDKANSQVLLNLAEKNNAFTTSLLERHPNLTQGERYLATLLRVNISTKEIAMLTGTTPKTVNMNRYRLRKSLGLTGEEDLEEYLKNI